MAYTKCKEEWGYEVTVESDISGCGLSNDDMYYYDGMVMSYDELIELLTKEGKLKVYNGDHKCECCEDKPAKYEYDGSVYCEECLRDEVLQEFETDVDGYFWELENDREYYEELKNDLKRGR